MNGKRSNDDQVAADEAFARSLDYGVHSWSMVSDQERLWKQAQQREKRKQSKKDREEKKQPASEAPAETAYHLDGLEVTPLMTFLAHCVQDVVSGETVHEAGTRWKKFVTSATLEDFLREFQALAARGLCDVKEIGSLAARVKFVCLRAVLVALGVTEQFMTRFDSYPASRQQRQPRATLLCTKKYALTIIFRRDIHREWLPLTFQTVGCACGRTDCRFLDGREVTEAVTEARSRGMGEAFVLPGELPAKRRRGNDPPQPAPPVTLRSKGAGMVVPKTCNGGKGRCSKGRLVVCQTAGVAFCLNHYKQRRAPRNNGRQGRLRVSTMVTVRASHWDPFVAHSVHGLTVPALTSETDVARHGDIGEHACALCVDEAVSVARFDEFAQRWLCLTHFTAAFPNEDAAEVSGGEEEGSGMDE